MKLKNRKDIPDRDKWKLEDIFPTDEAWEECFFALSERMGRIASYKGRLSDEDSLYECLTLNTSLSHDISKLYQYARMRRDEDTRVPLYQGMTDRADSLAVRLSSLAAFLTPELARESKERLEELAAKPRFADYSVLLSEVVRMKDIILSEKEERLMSLFMPVSGSAQKAFNDMNMILVLTEGGPYNASMVMTLYAYKFFFPVSAANTVIPQFGYGAALSFVSAIIAGLVTVIFLKFSKKMSDIY